MQTAHASAVFRAWMNGWSVPRYSVMTMPVGERSWASGQPAIASPRLRLSVMMSGRIVPAGRSTARTW